MPKTRELTTGERYTIFNRRQKGNSLQKIALDYGISKEGVRKIILKISNTGNAENRPRQGRNRKTTRRVDREIIKEVRKNPMISTKELKEKLHLPIQSTQIRQRIHEAGLHGRVSRRRPHISIINSKKRLSFAKTHLNKPTEFWKSIIWSDESKFELKQSRRRKMVWREAGKAFRKDVIQTTVKHGGGSIIVWGCFCSQGVGNLVVIEGIMNAQKYIEILEQNLTQSAEKYSIEGSFIFQHDNDPKHKAKVVTKYLEDNNIQVLEWPPQSLDLNPIEHLWDELDRRIPEEDRYNKQTFTNALKREWLNINQNTINKLILSMPNRLREVIKAKGYQTSY